ncbi:hypothetical protein GJAV_G00187470 [Gymnothorax javanicus]|nr:hypothetical protein GJAV_G00187470 [Gymnothorax javanicus]
MKGKTDAWNLNISSWMVLQVYLLLLYSGFSYPCKNVEYETDGECCPMCPPGTSVYKHCTEFTSTSCAPCPQNTFTDQPNGLHQCRPCTVCDSGLGLKTHRQCAATSDRECGPLDQYHCTETDDEGCRRAMKHTICRPGQFIKRNGTTSTDTECGGCPDKTFSITLNATHCLPHTECQDLGLQKIAAGTDTSDSICRPKDVNIARIIVPVMVLIVLLLLLILSLTIYCLRKRKRKEKTAAEREETSVMKQPQDEGSPGGPEPDPENDPEAGVAEKLQKTHTTWPHAKCKENGEQHLKVRKALTWRALNSMNSLWKSNLPRHIRISFFSATVESILLYGSECWTLTQALPKSLDGCYTRMLCMVLNIKQNEHITNKQLYGELLRVSERIAIRRMRIAGHCHRHQELPASKLVLWEPTHGRRSTGRPKHTYVDMLKNDAGA